VRYNPSWKAVLAYTTLLYYSNTTSGSCENVTMKTMAQRVGVGWQTFLRGLEELKRKGIVKVTHRSKESLKGGRVPLANLYELVDLQPDAGEPI
jgi:Mn-dependent DtxR family transcriptional regulator